MSKAGSLHTLGDHIVDGPAWAAIGDSDILYPSLTLIENRPGADPMVSMSIYEKGIGWPRLLRRVEWSYMKDASRRVLGPNDWPQVTVEYFLLPAESTPHFGRTLGLLDQELLNLAGASEGGSEVGPDEPLGFNRVVRKNLGELRIEVTYYAPLFPVLDTRWVSVWEELKLLCHMASAAQGVEEGYDLSPEAVRRALTQ